MSGNHVVRYALIAVLVFWIVGAFNRLNRLRGAMQRQFTPYRTQFELRQELLRRQIDGLTVVLPSAAPRLDALRAACEQIAAACAEAKAEPGAPHLMARLRVAEDTLNEARGRLPVQGAPGIELAELHNQLRGVDATLAFARNQFNGAVRGYNQAVRQFPAVLVGVLFRLRPAGEL